MIENIHHNFNSTFIQPDLLAEFINPLWTVEEVAAYLKLQPETIRSMARRGELPAIKLGKVWRFRKTDLEQLLVKAIEVE